MHNYVLANLHSEYFVASIHLDQLLASMHMCVCIRMRVYECGRAQETCNGQDVSMHHREPLVTGKSSNMDSTWTPNELLGSHFLCTDPQRE